MRNAGELNSKLATKSEFQSLNARYLTKVSPQNWTEEIFVVDEYLNTNPVTYKLVDLLGEKITGSFYEAELSPSSQDVFRIEKVLRRDQKKKKAFVKWKGYPDKFNSWVPLSDAEKLAFR